MFMSYFYVRGNFYEWPPSAPMSPFDGSLSALVLLASLVPMRFTDLRFHAHDPLYVFDADGDGVDDLAARGLGDRSGGLTIMRLDLAARRFVRLVSGFAWEQ